MRQESMSLRDTAEQTVRDIRRKTRKQYSAEEKIRIVWYRAFVVRTALQNYAAGENGRAIIPN